MLIAKTRRTVLHSRVVNTFFVSIFVLTEYIAGVFMNKEWICNLPEKRRMKIIYRNIFNQIECRSAYIQRKKKNAKIYTMIWHYPS